MAPKMHLGSNRAREGQEPYYVPHCGNRRSKQTTLDPLAVDCQSCEKAAHGHIELRARNARLRLIEEVEFFPDRDDAGKPTGEALTLVVGLDDPDAFSVVTPSGGVARISWEQADTLGHLLDAAKRLHRSRDEFADYDGPLTEESAITWAEEREAARPEWERTHRFYGSGQYWARAFGYREQFTITKGGPDNA